jgi:hypothetical protein
MIHLHPGVLGNSNSTERKHSHPTRFHGCTSEWDDTTYSETKPSMELPLGFSKSAIKASKACGTATRGLKKLSYSGWDTGAVCYTF